MDVPPPITDAELLEHARGLAYDTATAFEDAARRTPQLAFWLYTLAAQLRAVADDLKDAQPPTHP